MLSALWLSLVAVLLGCSPAEASLPNVPSRAAPLPGLPSPSALPATPLPTGEPPATGWTRYLGINQVHGVAFAPDGSLWAATTGGVARWNLADETYVQYTAAEGLISDYANDVALAADGSVWVAMLGGACRLVGATWTCYTPADGIAGETVQSVAVAPGGEVWVGTLSGVSRFDGRTWTGFLPGVRAWQVAVAADGSVWAANDGSGASRYSPADSTWTAYGPEQGLPSTGVKTVSVAPDGSVWVYCGYDGIYRFDGGRWQAVAGISVPWVMDVGFDASGAPWIATGPGLHGGGYGLLAPQDGGWNRVTAGQGLGSDTVHTVAAGPGGVVAAGTERGLSVLLNGQWRTLQGGPAVNRVTALAVTPEGAVWLGFGDFSAYRAGGGVSRYDGARWQYTLPGENVTVLAVDTRGGLWAGAGCTLRRWDGAAWIDEGGGCEALRGDVVDLAFGADGSVWVASGMRLGRLDGADWIFYDLLISSVAVTPNGTVWVSGCRGVQDSDYTARLEGDTWVEYPGRLGSLAVTTNGQVWAVAPDGAVLCFDGQAWSACGVTGPGSPARAGCLEVGPDGTLWAEGSAGPALLELEAWQVSPGALACAPDASLWLGTNNGLVRWAPAEAGP